jgi:hypothetical protein
MSVAQAELAVHTPATQASPAGHIWSQAPQFCGSLIRSTHAPPQRVPPVQPATWQTPFIHACPAAQSASVLHVCAAVHAPAVHASPAGQLTPQAPQFAGSLVRSTQAPPQSVPPVQPIGVHAPLTQASPLAHSESVLHTEGPVHTPAEQIWPATQATPHAPQLAASLRRSMQVPPQSVPALQPCAAHLPPVHTCPAAQSASALQVEPTGVSQAPAWHTSLFAQSAPLAQAWAQ